ncbi:hypothetical protein I7I50_10519 [Histoplasma capsulatum G186AR]|uniref:Uncharacterized protein n=1 Tax=Ajellomyces capsulatus TaxID=5037 RepID=A0A8H7Z3W4_AJECA|nr:hypothetical protein I7I52_01758 [Histoplasma capsulatum]QSS69281.1 hypothetical protein I7I50_10519 [Histoplasma capsulatum G186AR]
MGPNLDRTRRRLTQSARKLSNPLPSGQAKQRHKMRSIRQLGWQIALTRQWDSHGLKPESQGLVG